MRTDESLRGPCPPPLSGRLLVLASCGASFLLAVVGCARPNGSLSVAQTSSIKSITERGPVELALEFSPEKPRLSDEAKFVITIRAELGVRIDKLPFGDSLNEFLIRDFHEPLPVIDGKFEVQRKIYTLEPTRVGKLWIDPIQITFYDERPQGDRQPHQLESEGLEIEVTSILEEQAPSLDDLRPDAKPLPLPASPASIFWGLVCLGVLVSMGVLAWVFRRRTTNSVPIQLSPREEALRALEKLIDDRRAELDPKLFYVELTGIVRQFIERSTGVRAPEQTTEEFLREISHHERFPEVEQRRLRWFLESADLVKFAAVRPDRQEIEESLARARSFIAPQEVNLENRT